jgi:pyrroline-5-carboxylate reductase
MAADSITFIGGGNMARSLIAGLIRQGVPAAHIHVAEPVAALRSRWPPTSACRCTTTPPMPPRAVPGCWR